MLFGFCLSSEISCRLLYSSTSKGMNRKFGKRIITQLHMQLNKLKIKLYIDLYDQTFNFELKES